MALDHYVSQVHLKNFYSPVLGGAMYAMRKSELKRFPIASRSVCRIEGGSTNAYLIHDRAIEEFLAGIEPKYNASLARLRSTKIDQETIYSIAGFVACVAACSPTAMRINTPALENSLRAAASIMDRQGLLPKAPPQLGSKSLSELLDAGTVRVNVDQKYPQAMGISGILDFVSIFGNSAWEILINDHADAPFFTSDFQAAIEYLGENTAPNRVVPLAPDLAVRIVPDLRRGPRDLTFAKHASGRRAPPRSEVIAINRLIVQCAEDMVFYRDDHPWVAKFIAKNREFRIEALIDRIPASGGGIYNLARHRIVRRSVMFGGR